MFFFEWPIVMNLAVSARLLVRQVQGNNEHLQPNRTKVPCDLRLS